MSGSEEEVDGPVPGEIICGDYTYVNTLGSGTYGHVLQVKKDDKMYAMKQHINTTDVEKGISSDVVRELDILQTVPHKAILQAIEVFYDSDEDLCVILPLYMTNLANAMPVLHYDQKLSVAFRLLCGLVFLHRHNIVHYDIKPLNILYNNPDDVVIADFGLACVMLTNSRPHRGSRGTLVYNSPEMLNPTANTTSGFQDDIWAMGLTLLQLFMGDKKFGIAKNAIAKEQYSVIKGIFEDNTAKMGIILRAIKKEPVLVDIIAGMLAFNPKERITSAEIGQKLAACKRLESEIPLPTIDLTFKNYDLYRAPFINTLKPLVTDGKIPIDVFLVGTYISDVVMTQSPIVPDMTDAFMASYILAGKLCGYSLTFIDILFKIFAKDYRKRISTKHTKQHILDAEKAIVHSLNYELVSRVLPKIRNHNEGLNLVNKIFNEQKTVVDLIPPRGLTENKEETKDEELNMAHIFGTEKKEDYDVTDFLVDDEALGGDNLPPPPQGGALEDDFGLNLIRDDERKDPFASFADQRLEGPLFDRFAPGSRSVQHRMATPKPQQSQPLRSQKIFEIEFG
jgi:mitogen-activated protein kinase kinase 9